MTDSLGGLTRDTVIVHVDPIPPPPGPGPDGGQPVQIAALVAVGVVGAVAVLLVVLFLRRTSRARRPPGGVGPDTPPPGQAR